MGRKNTFSRALKHLRSTQINEGMPTNNTQGLMTVGDPAQYIPPEGEIYTELDFDKDNDVDDGENTDGIFLSDGTILTVEPPGDTSYVLGPMASMWYAWGNFTRIGYIRQSDRKMVNLGSITGELGDWDGESDFTSYGQLTLEQAVWFKNIEKKDNGGNDDPNYRAFYPGPPSNTPDEFGRYLCVITGLAKNFGYHRRGYTTTPDQGPSSPEDNFSAQQGSGRDQRGFFGDKPGRKGKDRGKEALAKGESITGDADTDKGLSDLWNIGRQGVQGLISAFSKALQGIRGKGLGGTTQLGFHGTSKAAADAIMSPGPGGKGIAGFKPGSRQNIYGTKGTFWAPSGGTQSGDLVPQAAKEFSKRGGNVGRGSFERAFSGTSKTAGATLPGVVPTGSGPGMNIPGTKWKEISTTGKTSNKAAEFGKRVMSGKYSKSAKAAQLLKTGATTASLTGARKLGKLAGRAAPGVGIALAAADVAKRGNDARNNFAKGNYADASLDIAGALMGGLSGVPGPIGWTALGAQTIFDVARSGVKTPQKMGGRSGRGAGRAAFREEYISEQLLYEGEDIDETMKGYMTLLSKALRDSLNGVGGIDPEEEDFLKILEDGQVGAPEDLEMVMKIIQKLAGEQEDVKESASLLIEDRKRVIREIKKPYKMPEIPTKFKVKPKGRVVGGGLMKSESVPPQFKSTSDNRMWRKYEYKENIRASQEKKNQVLELIGEGDHQWNYMLNNERWRTSQQMKKFYGNHDYLYDYYYGGKKHKVLRKEQLEKDFLLFLEDEDGVKSHILQSELNDLLAYEKDKEDFKGHYLYETEQKEREKNFDRATKLKSVIGQMRRGEIAPEYPDDPPPKMINNWHPKFGKKYKHDKLDPHSAEAMPKQGDPEIDASIEKATDHKAKARKLKNLLGKMRS